MRIITFNIKFRNQISSYYILFGQIDGTKGQIGLSVSLSPWQSNTLNSTTQLVFVAHTVHRSD